MTEKGKKREKLENGLKSLDVDRMTSRNSSCRCNINDIKSTSGGGKNDKNWFKNLFEEKATMLWNPNERTRIFRPRSKWVPEIASRVLQAVARCGWCSLWSQVFPRLMEALVLDLQLELLLAMALEAFYSSSVDLELGAVIPRDLGSFGRRRIRRNESFNFVIDSKVNGDPGNSMHFQGQSDSVDITEQFCAVSHCLQYCASPMMSGKTRLNSVCASN
ncbi:hypothetical protein P5673_016021 [Acropora cervicornis]|uniref:Uncharacterized protein n=1 Tax=Acropora cervicornis TaxID=6130 RepID=A0AAD9QGP9_ACRCE|nr:hypothetical protein P5673_016021 [Acropora cervicornis]